MLAFPKEQAIIDRLVHWAEKQPAVRAMLLTSSRTNPYATLDVFSDFDVLLVVTDIHRFHEDDRWLEDYGRTLVVLRNPIGREHGFESFVFVTHYEDGTKIDFRFFPVEFLRWVSKEPNLPDDLDDGYAVLLDKDHLTDGMSPPTHSAFIPTPPSESEYHALIEGFFNDSAYVAKHLWRDDLFPMKYCLDHVMKFQCLRKMLEWRMEIDHNWSARCGAYGKGLKKRVRPEIWSELESTFVGAGSEENWAALFKTVDLFRQVAMEAADHLGYTYPQGLDQRVTRYLQKVKILTNE